MAKREYYGVPYLCPENKEIKFKVNGTEYTIKNYRPHLLRGDGTATPVPTFKGSEIFFRKVVGGRLLDFRVLSHGCYNKVTIIDRSGGPDQIWPAATWDSNMWGGIPEQIKLVLDEVWDQIGDYLYHETNASNKCRIDDDLKKSLLEREGRDKILALFK